MEDKHAYLILAHTNWKQLGVLLSLLDDARNDIYVHIDLRASFTTADIQFLRGCVSKSKVVFIGRKKVYWADYSVADVELDLMEVATDNNHYHYYHLMSGMDLPLKTQDEIHDYFLDESSEFLGMMIDGGAYVEKHALYYHPFVNNPIYRNCKPLKAVDRGFMYVQRLLGLKRKAIGETPISTGWQWFSCTDYFCRYVLSQRDYIYDVFHHTLDVDEKFMGTMMNKLGEYERVHHLYEGSGNQPYIDGSLRMIDFYKTGNSKPYVWGSDSNKVDEDYEELMRSGCLFARKFDQNTGSEIINRIVAKLGGKVCLD